VLRVIARRDPCLEEVRIMNAMARMSAIERQKLLDEFVERVFEGVPGDAPGRRIGEAMKRLPAALPDEPSAEALSAWIELGELVSDASFEARVREMALAGASAPDATLPELNVPLLLGLAGAAHERAVPPRSSAGRDILDQIVPATLPEPQRARLARQLETFTDERVERYWQLIGVLHARPATRPQVPAFRWVIDALRS
jgi:hypothetical protein